MTAGNYVVREKRSSTADGNRTYYGLQKKLRCWKIYPAPVITRYFRETPDKDDLRRCTGTWCTQRQTRHPERCQIRKDTVGWACCKHAKLQSWRSLSIRLAQEGPRSWLSRDHDPNWDVVLFNVCELQEVLLSNFYQIYFSFNYFQIVNQWFAQFWQYWNSTVRFQPTKGSSRAPND